MLTVRHPNTQIALLGLLDCYERLNQPASAEPLQRELAQYWRRKAGPKSPQYASRLTPWGLSLIRQKKYAEAERVLRECEQVAQQTQADGAAAFQARSLLGSALAGLGKHDEAEPLLLSGYKGLESCASTLPPSEKARVAEALDRLIEFYVETKRPDDRNKWQAVKVRMAAASNKSAGSEAIPGKGQRVP